MSSYRPNLRGSVSFVGSAVTPRVSLMQAPRVGHLRRDTAQRVLEWRFSGELGREPGDDADCPRDEGDVLQFTVRHTAVAIAVGPPEAKHW